jgi:transposase
VGEASAAIRRPQRYQVGVAVAGQSLCESTFGGEATGPNPTDRAKLGTKRHTLTDRRGAPLSVLITKANMHDMKAAVRTLNGIVTRRPKPTSRNPQNICLDKGYDFPEITRAVIKRGYTPHIRRRGEDVRPRSDGRCHQAKRWVVERTGSWLNRFRRLLIRWEKKACNYLALTQLACCLTIYRLTLLG